MIDILPILAHAILNDNTINGLVDGQVHVGDPSTVTDDYLTDVNKTCILVTELISNASREMGNDETASDTQVQIDIVSKNSKAYARQVSDLVTDLLLDDIEITWDGVAIQLFDFNVIRHPLYENDMWKDVLTTSFKYWE